MNGHTASLAARAKVWLAWVGIGAVAWFFWNDASWVLANLDVGNGNYSTGNEWWLLADIYLCPVAPAFLVVLLFRRSKYVKLLAVGWVVLAYFWGLVVAFWWMMFLMVSW